MIYTAWIDDLRKDDIALAGGKGANLGELSHAGLPVPPGFVVSTKAYDAFVEANGLADAIVGRAMVTRRDDPAGFEEVAEGIRTLFSGSKVPEEMADEIRAAYQVLGEDTESPVAVRSSATAEDLPGMSFAGQQETYLNVRGAEALHIPAVLGTGVATRRIRSGQSVQVDGDAGTVTLLDGPSTTDAEQSLPEPVFRTYRLGVSTRTVALFALATGAVVAIWWRKRRRS
jgi:phosphoenolpyruvate synthase/pyruvate phosphate dikinase